MLRLLIKYLRQYKKTRDSKLAKIREKVIQDEFFAAGQIPWSDGYLKHRNDYIIQNIHNAECLKLFSLNQIPANYGYRLDERAVEYPWILSQIPENTERLLDAGSTLNFGMIVDHPNIKKTNLTIFTFAPEPINFNEKKISYQYGDLRELPYKDAYFDTIASVSTIEHIDMDNSMYGYDIKHNKDQEKKSYQYMTAIHEMFRALKKAGTLLLTFPYGKFEHHGFFQQLDQEMLARITDFLADKGQLETHFYQYAGNAWQVSSQAQCNNEESFNPHTGRGKKDDHAAHSRAICCLKFIKNPV